MRTHLDEAMSALPPDEPDVAARVFHYLVTPSGTKIAHTVSDLAEYAKLPQIQLTPVLETLSGGDVRILRPSRHLLANRAPRYEIFHDVLAKAILDWSTRHMQAQERAEVEQRAEEQRRRAEEAGQEC